MLETTKSIRDCIYTKRSMNVVYHRLLKVCMKKFRLGNFFTEVHPFLQAAKKEMKKSVIVNIDD